MSQALKVAYSMVKSTSLVKIKATWFIVRKFPKIAISRVNGARTEDDDTLVVSGEQGIEPSGAANDLRPQSVTSITGRSRPNTRDVATPGTPGAPGTAGGGSYPTRS